MMTRQILSAVLLFVSCIAVTSEAAQFVEGSPGGTIGAVLQLTPDEQGSGDIFCFNIQVNGTSVGPIVVNGGPPNKACWFSYEANGDGTFNISANPGFGVVGQVTVRALRNFQQVAVTTFQVGSGGGGPPPPPPPPPPPDPDPESPGTPGSSPIRAPKPTDTTFLASGPGLRTPCTFWTSGSLRFSIEINRVVGAVNGDGTLADPTTLIANGVVSATTALRVPAFDVDSSGGIPSPALPELDSVWVNGFFVGYLTGANGVWTDNKLFVPTQWVRFGARNPNPGDDPIAGVNDIEIRIDQANFDNGKSFYCTAVDWAAMSFDALAPVIMVHGNNSGGDFFADRHNAAGDQLGFHFIEAFQQQQIPFDNSLNMTTASVANHAALLKTAIPALAKQFGAKHVHLVAHSKGGLDVRAFLATGVPSNFGVLSLTTLSTPHHGSVGADYVIDAVGADALDSDDTTRTLLAQQLPPPDAGQFDLRVSSVAAFNATNLPALPHAFTVDGVTRPVVYQSISADANLDHSAFLGRPTIQINETRGTPQRENNKSDTTWEFVMGLTYRTLGDVASTQVSTAVINGHVVRRVRETPTPVFQLNDFLVTLNSARMTGFRELTSTLDNHATVANPANGQVVIDAIRTAQPLREP